MLTGSIVISGPSSIMEPTVPGTTANAHVSISLAMYSYGDSGTVQWATQPVANGATPGEDYDTSSGTVSLSYLNAQVYVDIPIKYDTLSEPSEAFQVVLSNPTGNLGIMQGTLTISITDNSPPPPPPPQYPLVATVNFSDSGSHHIFEGDEREIHVVRDLSYGELIVYYVIADDSVASEDDVTLEPAGSVTFAPGQTEATIRLTAEDDSTIEVHELLKLSLVTYPAPNQGPGAYLVGSAADSFTTINDNNEVIFSDLTVDWKTPDGGWQNSPDTEMLWQDDELRWTVTLPPEEIPFAAELTSLQLLKRSHDNLAAPWEEFSQQSFTQNPDNLAQYFIFGNPFVGDWDITVRGILSTLDVWLLHPVHRVANAIASVTWQRPDDDPNLRLEMHDEGDNNLYTGPRIYPEFSDPIEAGPQSSHTWAKIDVELAMQSPVGVVTDVHLKLFDPDNRFNAAKYSDIGAGYLDPNDLVADSAPNPPFEPFLLGIIKRPNDNRSSSGSMETGAYLVSPQVEVLPGTKIGSTTMHLISIQPGNNYRVAAHGRQAVIDAVHFGTDAVSFRVGVANAPLTASNASNVLEVWRTLHIESDSMGEPPVTDPDEFVTNTDDPPPNPRNVRGLDTSLVGDLFRPACIDVAVVSPQYDTRDDSFFQHNIEDAQVDQPDGSAFGHASDMRDVANVDAYWVVQVVACYEGNRFEAWDAPSGKVTLGITTGIEEGGEAGIPVCFVYLECIRDRAAYTGTEYPHSVDETTLERRIVAHEVGHTFLGGHNIEYANQGIMSSNDAIRNPDAAYSRFTAHQLGVIQSQPKPHAIPIPVQPPPMP